MTSLSGRATNGSCEHLLFRANPPVQILGTNGFCPGLIYINLIDSQSLHLTFNLDALMNGFVVDIIIPCTTNNFCTSLLVTSLSFLGESSLTNINCQLYFASNGGN